MAQIPISSGLARDGRIVYPLWLDGPIVYPLWLDGRDYRAMDTAATPIADFTFEIFHSTSATGKRDFYVKCREVGEPLTFEIDHLDRPMNGIGGRQYYGTITCEALDYNRVIEEGEDVLRPLLLLWVSPVIEARARAAAEEATRAERAMMSAIARGRGRKKKLPAGYA